MALIVVVQVAPASVALAAFVGTLAVIDTRFLAIGASEARISLVEAIVAT